MEQRKIGVMFVLLLAMLADVANQPLLSPDCTRLQPQLCQVIPDVDSTGATVYTSFSEECTKHVCVKIRPILPPPPPYTPPTAWSPPTHPPSGPSPPWMPILNLTAPPPPPPSGIVVHASQTGRSAPSFGKYASYGTSQDTPWFCGGLKLNYTARVEASTGYPPGYKEDLFARCHYNRLIDIQSLGDCRGIRYSCKDCQAYYRNWCPLTDSREYGDYPNCNALGLDEGPDAYAKSIYR